MPKDQTHRSRPHAASSTSGAGAGAGAGAAGPSYKALPIEKRDPTGLAGVSKLKASIRQTKRLLAKDTLDPGLRVQTERRLKSLEADLARAERRGVEKKNGEKYHMVKFFERQKLVRLIKRLGRQSDTLSELEKARVMLNYVLNYPNERKYISLFPSTSSTEPSTKPSLTLPNLLPNSDQPDPDLTVLGKGEKRRMEMLLRVRNMMRDGTLPAQPEKDLQDRDGQGDGEREARNRGARTAMGLGDELVAGVGGTEVGGHKGKKGKNVGAQEQEDEFFESD
ncbi:hypothetical protein BCR39DRAFT_542702 [Naematelia encephala]|uniref:rRNA-processing protein EFG1 n=1 Tax=Naematelia encephala TaxID=71784 RepID=A0A1Y2ATS7_9TREE|nr:hypothetical protein BCR39DRAFT_542702 [Naematelia encephala]